MTKTTMNNLVTISAKWERSIQTFQCEFRNFPSLVTWGVLIFIRIACDLWSLFCPGTMTLFQPKIKSEICLKLYVYVMSWLKSWLYVNLPSHRLVCCTQRRDGYINPSIFPLTRPIALLGPYFLVEALFCEENTLLGTNISPKNGILKMIFLFPRWDMLIPWRVSIRSS